MIQIVFSITRPPNLKWGQRSRLRLGSQRHADHKARRTVMGQCHLYSARDKNGG